MCEKQGKATLKLETQSVFTHSHPPQVLEDKTFGLKNKKKSKKVQQYVPAALGGVPSLPRLHRHGRCAGSCSKSANR